jgi:hypothetical protein
VSAAAATDTEEPAPNPPVPPTPPTPPARPVSHLALRWRLPSAAPVARVGTQLVVYRRYPWNNLEALSPTSGLLEQALPWADARLHRNWHDGWGPRPRAMGELLLLTEVAPASHAVHSAYTVLGERAWSRDAARITLAVLDAGAGLFSVGPGWSHTGTGSLARVDIATGSTLWTQQLPTGWLEVRAAVRGLVLAFSWVSDDAASTTLFALDAANGSVRWSVSLPVAYRSGRALDANEAGVLVSGATGVWELDPDSGAIRWAASQELPPSTQPSAVLAQGVAIVRAPDGSVVALERVTGAPARWQRTDLRLHRTSELIRHGELVFCDTERGELHVLDPASGASLWSYSGVWGSMVYAAGEDPELFVCVGPDLLAFGRDAGAPAQHTLVVTGRLRVNGRPARGVEVQLGSATGLTDRQGRFRLESRVPGHLRFNADEGALAEMAPRRPCLEAGSTQQYFDNDGTMTSEAVDLNLTATPVGWCGECDCR